MNRGEIGMGMPEEISEENMPDSQAETDKEFLNYAQEMEEKILAEEEDKDKKEPKKSRLKKALCAITAGLILFGSAESGFAGVGGCVEKSGYNQENSQVSIKNQTIEKETSATDKVEITPEFQRNMEKVLLSDPPASREEIRKIYHDLLLRMPNYSIIQVLIREGREENFKKIIDEIQEQEGGSIDLRQRLQIISSNNPGGLDDIWAQDFGEMAKINGKDTFIIPADLEGDAFPKDTLDWYKQRNKIAAEWLQKQGLEIKQADFFFEGGNVTFDKTEKGLRVFVGYSDIFYSQGLKKNGDQKSTPKMIAQKISKCFGGAEVVVMGDKELINTCFHIDQAFVILDGKQAVINQCASPCYDDEGNDVSWQLKYYKKQLEGLGYKIIEIENTSQQLKDSHSSTNVIPFVDKNTGQKKVILPIFSDEIKENTTDKEKIDYHSLQGKGLAAYHAYLKAGYEPILIRDHTYVDKGNTHCISNVLSKNIIEYGESKNA